MTAYFLLSLTVLLMLLLMSSRTVSAQERAVEKARCKSTAKARQYQALIQSMPEVVFPEEIYSAAYKF